MLVESLELHGYHVLSARDGEQGVRAFTQGDKAIRLVIVDMIMPVLDGLATIIKLRSLRPDIRIIAVTGFLDSERFRKLEALQVDAVVSKPYDMNNLLEKIKEII